MNGPEAISGATPVSVAVLTFMEEANLETCLRSVSGWAEDIHVVDSGSTDRTIEIAHKLANHVHHHPYVDHRSQIEYVLAELPLKHDWLLILDADHQVSQELKNSIDSMLAAEKPDIDLFYFPQTYVFRGQPIRSVKKWGRLLRHKNVQVEGGELVDFRYRPRGATGFLHGQIVESNLKENDLDFWIDKHQRFASRMAVEELLRRSGTVRWSVQPRLRGNPDERTVWLKSRWYSLPLFIRPFLYFGYRYVCRLGFIEGRTGLLFHFLQAFWYRLVIDVKLSELERLVAAGDVRIADLLQSYVYSSGGARRAAPRTGQDDKVRSDPMKPGPNAQGNE